MSLNSDLIFPDFLDKSESFDVVSEPFIGYDSKNRFSEFERTQRLAVQSRGIVMPNLRRKQVKILEVKKHDFNSDKPLIEAQEWAEKNLINIYTSHKGTFDEFKYQISKKAINKYLQPSATGKSCNISVHLSVLQVLPAVIDVCIETEIHADYTKFNGIRSIDNPINDNVLIHRFYGAIRLDLQLYRIKLTILEYKQSNQYNKPYTFEVIKIELIDKEISNSSNFGTKVADSNETDLLSVAKLLQNIEKSYDKGRFLLDESK